MDPNGNRTGTIAGQAGDPIADFRITRPANQQSAEPATAWSSTSSTCSATAASACPANYTLVQFGPEVRQPRMRDEQFALEGLSDSANLVGFYENYGWSVRAAYNWRDEFLAEPLRRRRRRTR